MATTTEAAVRKIIKTALTSEQVTQFIDDAALWVAELLADEGYTAARTEAIERYLACALIRLRDLGLTNVTIREASEKYQVDPEVTDYLLRAAGFDTSGKIRLHFLAPEDSTLRAVSFATGTGYKCEEPPTGEECS